MKNNTDTEKCCKCGAPATTLWPYLDPDIPGQPYCDRCIKQIRRDMMLALLDMKPINKEKK